MPGLSQVHRGPRSGRLLSSPLMATSAEAFQAAFAHHQAGQLREAEAIYRQILQTDPHHVEALHLLGLVAYQVGQPATAVELIGRAIALRDDRAVFHGNLGEAHRALVEVSLAVPWRVRAAFSRVRMFRPRR